MVRRHWPDELVNDPLFADADTVVESAHVYVGLALEALAERVPEAADLAGAIAAAPAHRTHRLFQSPALRCAVFELLAVLPDLVGRGVTQAGAREAAAAADAIDTGEPRDVLREAAALLASPPDRAVLLEGDALPLGDVCDTRDTDMSGFRLWSPRTPPGPGQRLLTRQFDRTIGASVSAPNGPGTAAIGAGTEAQAEVLTQAVTLLSTLAPELTASVGRHVHLVAIVHTSDENHARVLSASDSTIPGALFLSDAAVGDRLSAAEALLHEGTHQRLYDLMLCRQLYAAHYSPETSPRVTPPWYAAESGAAAAWHADRVLAAFHVYVHLAALWSAALAGRAADVLTARERPIAAARLRRCFDKGDYLLARLRGAMRPALGPDGLRFVEFLARAFARLDPASPCVPTSSKEFV